MILSAAPLPIVSDRLALRKLACGVRSYLPYKKDTLAHDYYVSAELQTPEFEPEWPYVFSSLGGNLPECASQNLYILR